MIHFRCVGLCAQASWTLNLMNNGADSQLQRFSPYTHKLRLILILAVTPI